MPTSLRSRLGALAFATLIAGCSTAVVQTDATGEGGLGNDPGVDSGPPPPPCSRLTTVCEEGGACEGAPDCASSLCRDGECRAVDPADGTKNGDETDIDCGGTKAPACSDGKGCAINADCTSTVCRANVCQAPTSTDGVRNGDETGTDCGGSTTMAPKCAPGQGCLTDTDCDKVVCDTFQKKCKDPTHDDGIKNLDETGIDCGGPTATVARCATGQGCASSGDCANVLCNAGTLVCDPPTKTDGLKNGTETDIDCGGGAPTNAPKCVIDKACNAGTDCVTGGCSVGLGKKCAPLSCATAEVSGINSCGAIETGQAGAAAAHESCCKSLVLPTRTTRRLDKYEITSGRYRSFLSTVGPNVRAWVNTYAAANPGSQLASLATQPIVDGSINAASTLQTLYPNADRFVPHSLTAHTALDIDNYGGIRGCANYGGSYSANTYWQDATHYADFGLPARSLARSFSDEKSLNCAMPMMLAAFCAWDGGELALLADYQDAWTATYPWGATDTNRPSYNWCNGTYSNGGFTCQCDGVHNLGAGCPAGGFAGLSGAGVFYEWPRNTDRSKDNEPLIAAPGRIPTDATALKSGGESWMDLYANLAEYTGDFNYGANLDFCDFATAPGGGATKCARLKDGNQGTQYTGIPRSGIIGVSWEGHKYNRGSTNGFQATFQYGKFGGRCVRPATPY
jgi:hypothetical protein